MSRHSVLIVSLYLFAGVVARAGEFQTHVDYGAGTGPYSVAVGDFNGDGKPDLATANAYDNTVSVLLGNGDGTFQTPWTTGPELIPTRWRWGTSTATASPTSPWRTTAATP